MKNFRFRELAALLVLTSVVNAGEPDGLFVAVGYGGRRVSSLDGERWENDQRWSDEARDDDNVLFDIAFGHGRFIAVGGGASVGHLLSTRDGKDWHELPKQKGRVATIAFGSGRFVAAHDAELLYSTDGESFERGAKLDWPGSVHARRSAFGDTEAGRMFVIIGDVDLAAEGARVSWRASTTDGVRFAKAEHHTPDARDIAYGSGHFVVVGPRGLIESSHDGQTWQRHDMGVMDDFSRVVWTGRRFLVSGGKLAWSSPDGLTWSPESAGIPCDLAWVRENGAVFGLGFSWGGNVHVSRDLAQWRKVAVPAGPAFTAVARGRR